MSKVVAAMSISVDGFVGGKDESDWLAAHEAILGWVFPLRSFNQQFGNDEGLDNEDSRILAAEKEGVGAYVLGRNMFDFGEEPWGRNPPFHAPVFVVTHREREPLVRAGGTTFHFVTDGIASAIAQAKAAAGDRDVFVSGGASTTRQALGDRHLDELYLHIAPLVLGRGTRLFDETERARIDLEPIAVNGSQSVTHVGYRVVE